MRFLILLTICFIYQYGFGQTIYQKLYGIGQTGIGLGSFEYYSDSTALVASRIQNDILLFKLDSIGNKIWSKKYGHSNYQTVVTRSLKTINNEIILIGYRNQTGSSDNNIVIANLDTSGTILWSLAFGDTLGDQAIDIVQIPDSSFMISGGYNIYNSNFAKSQSFISKLDKTGNLLWTKTYGPICDSCRTNIIKICKTIDNNLMLFGQSTYSGNSFQRFKTICKVDLMGNVLWSKVYFDLCENSTINRMISTSDGNYLLLGTTCNSSINGDLDILLMKIDSIGNVIWSKKYSGLPGSVDQAYELLETFDGNYLFSGASNITKVNSDGILVWSSYYLLSPVGNYTLKIAEVFNKYFVMSSVIFNNFNNLYILQVDTSGIACINNTFSYNSSNTIIDDSLVIINQNSVTPLIDSTDYIYSPITIQDSLFCQSEVNIPEIQPYKDIFDYYPNPASDKLYLNMDGNFIKSIAQIIVTDLNGLRNFVIKYNVYDNKLEVDISSLPNGFYFIEVVSINSVSFTKKFIKQNK